MPEITSTRNPRVREVIALHRSRARRESGRHLVEGPNAVAEALSSGLVENVFLAPDGPQDLVIPDGVVVNEVSDHVLERLSDARTPQGVVAVARTATASLAEVVGEGFLVLLHEVADPGNAGTILRTADAAGAHAVVVTAGSVDVFSPKSIRAAAGSTYHLPVVVDTDLSQVVAVCRERSQRVLALDGGGDTSVFDLEQAAFPLVLVLGNEAHGLPPEIRELVDDVVAVPILGRAESLNVGAAAAVALYAAARGLRRSS